MRPGSVWTALAAMVAVAVVSVQPAAGHGPGHAGAFDAAGSPPLEPLRGSTVFDAPLGAAAAGPVPTTVATILSVADFHGRLNPTTFRVDVKGQEYGGAAYLQTYFRQREALSPTPPFLVTQGDAVGATQPVSGLLGDRPTIDVMNRMGFDADTLGNHNFDRGIAHMRDLARDAQFPYLVANLTGPGNQPLPWTKRYAIWDVGGTRIGVTGVINEDAESLLKPGALGQLRIHPAAAALNRVAEELARQGVRTVVALAHFGADPTKAGTDGPTGPLIALAKELEGIDVLLGDHTYWQVNQPVVTKNGKVVWVAQSVPNGVMFTEVRLTISDLDGETLAVAADQFMAKKEGVAADPEIAAVVAAYNRQVEPIVKEVVGSSARTIPLDTFSTRESNQGNLVADALRAGTGAQLALINSGGLRDRLTRDERCANGGTGPCVIERGDVLGMLPFNNQIGVATVTGRELKAMLENGVSQVPTPAARFPQISGFSFRYSLAGAPQARVRSAALADGTPIQFTDEARYTIATNDFIAGGGDGYAPLTGRMSYVGEDADLVVSYLQAHAEVDPPGPPHGPAVRIIEE